MLISILIDVQYSQEAVFSFDKGSNSQNRSSSGSIHTVKKSPPPSKISDSPLTEGNLPPTPYRYLENPDPIPSFKSN